MGNDVAVLHGLLGPFDRGGSVHRAANAEGGESGEVGHRADFAELGGFEKKRAGGGGIKGAAECAVEQAGEAAFGGSVAEIRGAAEELAGLGVLAGAVGGVASLVKGLSGGIGLGEQRGGIGDADWGADLGGPGSDRQRDQNQ